jgi:hypothetical protein
VVPRARGGGRRGVGASRPSIRPAILEALRKDWVFIAGAGALSAALTFPLLREWWSAAQVVGFRNPRKVFLARGQSWLNVGPDSWWYGGLVRRLQGLRSQTNEQQFGVGLLTLGVAGFGFWRARHRGGVVVLAATGLALVLLATQVGPWRAASPWNVVYAMVPGAAAIRAVPRVGLVVLLVWAAGLALAIDVVSRARPLASAALAVVCLLEQGVSFGHFVPAIDRARVQRIAREVDRGCTAFVYTPAPDGWPPWHAQIDALWVTDAAGVPTLNGYSGNAPPGWMLEDCLVRGPRTGPGWTRQWRPGSVAGAPGQVCRIQPAP